MTGGTLTFGSGFNARLIAQGEMNQAALIGRHGAQLHAAMLRLRASSGGVCHRLDFLTLAVLITLDVDDNRVTEAHRARCDGGNDELQRVERFAMAANKDSQVVARDIQNKARPRRPCVLSMVTSPTSKCSRIPFNAAIAVSAISSSSSSLTSCFSLCGSSP